MGIQSKLLKLQKIEPLKVTGNEYLDDGTDYIVWHIFLMYVLPIFWLILHI